MNASKLFLLLAVICFVLAAFGFAPLAGVSIGWAGLAFFAGAGLV